MLKMTSDWMSVQCECNAHIAVDEKLLENGNNNEQCVSENKPANTCRKCCKQESQFRKNRKNDSRQLSERKKNAKRARISQVNKHVYGNVNKQTAPSVARARPSVCVCVCIAAVFHFMAKRELWTEKPTKNEAARKLFNIFSQVFLLNSICQSNQNTMFGDSMQRAGNRRMWCASACSCPFSSPLYLFCLLSLGVLRSDHVSSRHLHSGRTIATLYASMDVSVIDSSCWCILSSAPRLYPIRMIRMIISFRKNRKMYESTCTRRARITWNALFAHFDRFRTRHLDHNCTLSDAIFKFNEILMATKPNRIAPNKFHLKMTQAKCGVWRRIRRRPDQNCV